MLYCVLMNLRRVHCRRNAPSPQVVTPNVMSHSRISTVRRGTHRLDMFGNIKMTRLGKKQSLLRYRHLTVVVRRRRLWLITPQLQKESSRPNVPFFVLFFCFVFQPVQQLRRLMRSPRRLERLTLINIQQDLAELVGERGLVSVGQQLQIVQRMQRSYNFLVPSR